MVLSVPEPVKFTIEVPGLSVRLAAVVSQLPDTFQVDEFMFRVQGTGFRGQVTDVKDGKLTVPELELKVTAPSVASDLPRFKVVGVRL